MLISSGRGGGIHAKLTNGSKRTQLRLRNPHGNGNVERSAKLTIKSDRSCAKVRHTACFRASRGRTRRAATIIRLVVSNGVNVRVEFHTTEEIKREIDRLFEIQHQALDRATFLGMTPDEAKEMEARRKVITTLVDKLVERKRQTPKIRH